MKTKSTQTLLICIAACLLLCNIGFLYLHHQDKNKMKRAVQSMSRLGHLKNVEFMFEASKEITRTRFRYEQYQIGNVLIYLGSDNNTLFPVLSITDHPKLVFGLNQNMCSPCIEGALKIIKEFFPDYETNPNIICIADIEQRFKDNYFGKKVISFQRKADFPLYEIELMPYFFILDKDLVVKLLFITDKTSPELTKEYLKIIKDRYPDI